MAEALGSKLGFFAKIREEEDAVKIVRAASLAFIAVGCFFTIASVWSSYELWVHGLAYIVLGFMLRQLKSRVIALLLVLLAVMTALIALKVFSGQNISMALNVILSVVVFGIGLRAVEATFKLRARKAAKVPVGDA